VVVAAEEAAVWRAWRRRRWSLRVGAIWDGGQVTAAW